MSLLSFYKHRDVESEPSIEDDFLDTHKNNLLNNKHLFKILHLNCQSLASTFTDFEAMNYECNFDDLTLSETWLTLNREIMWNYLDVIYIMTAVAAYVTELLKCKI